MYDMADIQFVRPPRVLYKTLSQETIAVASATMKLSAVILASFAGTASAFAPSMQPRQSWALFMDTATRQAASSVDKSMEGMDSDPDTFDPTEGDSPALTRNNNGEVWVPQVRT
jgi:hypothetical protein